ncbi:50S ribosome-binding GTPase [Candidatus Woesearchaeota archaeon]|nr:50S ribosome-binding GTPase [Candidatus Woesearchaeota archaeon]
MVNFWSIVNDVIDKSDILLEVLDSRLPDMTRNAEVEGKVKRAGKKLILVLNKADLIGQRTAEKEKRKFTKEYPVVFVSTREHQGTKLLREAILKNTDKQEITVGVLGYPNTGKSSIINVLKGRKAASTSPQSGHTRSLQRIRVTNRIMMLDTPGVVPFEEKDEVKHVLIGSVMYSDTEHPDLAACEIIKHCNQIDEQIILLHFGVSAAPDEYALLETIAKKRNIMAKGGVFDVERAARLVIQDWQMGKIKLS